MRIRGRWAPSPPPLPPDVQSSAHQPLFLPRTHGPSLLATKTCVSLHLQQDARIGVGEDKYESSEENSNIPTNPRTDRSPSVETSADSSISSSLSHHGHWLEEDKVFPLKKRKLLNLKSEPSISKMPRKTLRRKRSSKIWADYIVKDDDFEWVVQMENPAKSKRARDINRERCNRANGRGWRCCRPAVDGSSMCDHHLTKKNQLEEKKVLLKAGISNAKPAKKYLSKAGISIANPAKKYLPKAEISNAKPAKKLAMFSSDYKDSIEGHQEGVVFVKGKNGHAVAKARAISSLLR